MELLTLLGEEEAAGGIEIGGGIALWHYSPHRQTNDIDARWPKENEACREAISRVVANVADRHGLEVFHRAQSGYESWDLKRSAKTVFAFQIARKSRRLEPPLPSPWGRLQMESLRENIANKMTALVQRGAPRDFLDIAAVLRKGLLAARDCWSLWQEKNPDFSVKLGRANILKYLNALEARRPLATILDDSEREQARATRELIRGFVEERRDGD